MKKFISFLLLISFSVLFSQKKINDSLANILLQNNTFTKKTFSKKYQLIGEFKVINKRPLTKLAKVKTEKGWGFINENGKEVIPAVFSDLTIYRNGFIIGNKLIDKDSENKQICYLIFNYQGNLLEDKICIPHYSNYSSSFGFRASKNLLIFLKNDKYGAIDISGKVVIPFQYTEIQNFGNYLFCENFPKNYNDILDFNGKFIKKINSTNIQYYIEKKQLVQVIDVNDKRYMYDLKKLEPATEKYSWGQFEDYSENPNFYLKIYDYDYPRTNFILNNKFKIINPDYPDSFSFKEKFLIHKDFDEATILNQKGEKVASYPIKNFIRYSFLAPYQLDKPEFFEKNGDKFLKYYEVQSVNHEYLFDDFRFLYDINPPVKNVATINFINVVDAMNGEVLFTLKPSELEIKNTSYFYKDHIPFFIINYKNNTAKIFDNKGNIFKDLDYNLEKIDENYYQFEKNGFKNLLDTNRFKNIFPNNTHGFGYLKFPNYFIFSNEEKKSGIINNNGEIVKQPIYKEIFNINNTEKYILTTEDFFEIFDLNTLQTTLKFNTKNIDAKYQDGFIYFGNTAIIDLYGNYYQNYVPPPPQQLFYEK